MSVRAKFTVDSVTRHQNGTAIIELLPVINGSPENEQFFKWTPGGTIKLQTVNPEAAKQFEPGKAMYIDFTPAE